MKIIVRGLEVYAYHGVSSEERTVGHRYVADLEYTVGDDAGQTDDVADSVDYGAVSQFLEMTIRNEQCLTLEHLVTLCGDRIMSSFPVIQSLLLRISKRLPPAPIIAESIGVERGFRRS